MTGSCTPESAGFDSPCLDAIWNSSTGAIAVCSDSGIVQRVNRRFARLFLSPGYDGAGRHIDSLVTPVQWIAESDSLSAMVLNGKPVSFTTARKAARGDLVQVFLTLFSIFEDDRRKYLVYIIKPVPDQSKKRSSDRMEHDTSLTAAFENSCEPSLITDSEGTVLKSNSALTAEFGFRHSEIAGSDVREKLIPEEIRPEADYIRAMTGAGRTLRLETCRLTAEGTGKAVSLIASPMTGSAVFRVYRTEDSQLVTENSIASRNRFKNCPATGNRSGMLFQCRTDRQRTMEFIVPGTASFTGFSEEQLLRGETPYGSVILETDRELVLKAIQDSLVTGSEYSITYRISNSSGSVLWVMEQGRAFRAGRDSVDFCEGCIIDAAGIEENTGQESDSRERIEKLHTIAGELQRSRSAGEIYRICSAAGRSILDGVCSCVFLEDGNELKIIASAGKEDYPCEHGCSLGMAEIALSTPGPCYFRSRDTSEGFCPAGDTGVCFKLGSKAVFQVISRSRSVFGTMDSRILELLLGYTEQGLKRIALQQQLISQALHDPLTGIYNRNYFNRFIQLEEHRARKLDSSLSFIMVDVDNFKSINDRFGHQTGDRVLTEVARVLESALRKTDTVLRYGGDEFLIILTRMNGDYTHIVEARIETSLKKAAVPEEFGKKRISVSMGHAFWNPDGEDTIDAALKAADMAMLRNKKNKSRNGTPAPAAT